jgi:hypothetical protein
MDTGEGCGLDMFGIPDVPTDLAESERGHFPEVQRGEYGDARDPKCGRFSRGVAMIEGLTRCLEP